MHTSQKGKREKQRPKYISVITEFESNDVKTICTAGIYFYSVHICLVSSLSHTHEVQEQSTQKTGSIFKMASYLLVIVCLIPPAPPASLSYLKTKKTKKIIFSY